MPAKKHKPRVTSSGSCMKLKSCSEGRRPPRLVGDSEQTYYRWRRAHGGLKTGQAWRMKDLEKENLRLRRAIADLTLDNLILQEAAKGTFGLCAVPALH